MRLKTKIDKQSKNSASFSFQHITAERLNSFRQEIEETCWSDMFCLKDVNEIYKHFKKLFESIYKRHFPHQVLRTSKKNEKIINSRLTWQN